MRKLLFVCTANRLRSPTAEAVFAGRDEFEVSSAGTASDAECAVDAGLIEWADEIYAMEQCHVKRLRERFAKTLKGKRVAVLGIPDEYACVDPALVELLKVKMGPYLERA